MSEPGDWRQYGEYTGGECAVCKRQRMMASMDDEGRKHLVCEKCGYEEEHEEADLTCHMPAITAALAGRLR